MSIAHAQRSSRFAAAALLASRLAAAVAEWRRDEPRITLLCMDFGRRRRARVELRIERAATSGGWTIRRVEVLTPAIAGLAIEADGPSRPSLETTLYPCRQDGRWFEGGASFWLDYAVDAVPAHEVHLRLTLEHADGRRRSILASAVFPAMNWIAATPPRRAPQPPATACSRPVRVPVEAGSAVDAGGLSYRRPCTSAWASAGAPRTIRAAARGCGLPGRRSVGAPSARCPPPGPPSLPG